MPFKLSFYHKQLSLLIFRSVGWVSILSFLVVFFAVPLHLMLIDKELKEDSYSYQIYDHLFNVNDFFQMAVIIVMPILLAIFLFRFMQHKAYSDLIHSLPISRTFLFHYYCISGALLLILPILLNGFLLRIIYPFFQLEKFFPVSEIYYWTAVFCVFSILLYISTVFVGMFTGISILQGVFTCLFLLFPTGFVTVLCYNFHFWIDGFPLNEIITDKTLLLSPILVPVILESSEGKVFYYTCYFLCSIFLYVFAFALFKKRKVESISQAFVFSKLKGVFKYTFTISCMLIGSLYGELVTIGKIGIVIGNIMGAFIGFILVEMILEKTWRVFFRIKKFPLFIGIVAIVMFSSIPLVHKYEQFRPAAGSIQSVSFQDNFISDPFAEKMMNSSANIQHVLAIHKKILEQKREPSTKEKDSLITLKYKLNNGRKVVRSYEINRADYQEWLQPLYESEEFKILHLPLFTFRSDEINDMVIEPQYKNDYIRLSSKQEIKEFLSVLLKDIVKEPYKSMTTNYAISSSIMISFQGKRDETYHIELKPSYKESRKWLAEKNMLEKAVLVSDDVQEVAVTKAKDVGIKYHGMSEIAYEEKNMADIKHKVIVKDDRLKQKILDSSVHNKEDYVVVLTYKFRNYVDIAHISKEELPDSLIEELEKN
ncbi:DUF6449 domain-containing protein [Niallia sp. 01092]|uniref:DUF6449 domain-containing protein n=1 Tax=unclassified Niallia TaxID=2837522 RepID=UPI003FD4592A